jgi:hypothetical protein
LSHYTKFAWANLSCGCLHIPGKMATGLRRAKAGPLKMKLSGPENLVMCEFSGPEKGPARNACKKFLTSRANLHTLCPPQRPLSHHPGFLFRTLNKEKL